MWDGVGPALRRRLAVVTPPTVATFDRGAHRNNVRN